MRAAIVACTSTACNSLPSSRALEREWARRAGEEPGAVRFWYPMCLAWHDGTPVGCGVQPKRFAMVREKRMAGTLPSLYTTSLYTAVLCTAPRPVLCLGMCAARPSGAEFLNQTLGRNWLDDPAALELLWPLPIPARVLFTGERSYQMTGQEVSRYIAFN
jgi:hypothetical protein